jgi:hypothetical protein
MTTSRQRLTGLAHSFPPQPWRPPSGRPRECLPPQSACSTGCYTVITDGDSFRMKQARAGLGTATKTSNPIGYWAPPPTIPPASSCDAADGSAHATSTPRSTSADNPAATAAPPAASPNTGGCACNQNPRVQAGRVGCRCSHRDRRPEISPSVDHPTSLKPNLSLTTGRALHHDQLMANDRRSRP